MATATRRRRPAEDVEEDETPRRRRRVEEDAEETRPRRRRPEPEPDDDDDDDEDAEEAPRSRRRAPRDDEEERPRRRAGGRVGRGPSERAGRGSGRRMARGWDGYQKVKAAASDFETKFKPSSEAQVVALLEEEPFAAFGRHWVDLDEGKRAFMCLGSLEADEDADDDPGCPLCDVGHKPNGAKAYLNVAVLREGEKPSHEVWEIGPKISEMLEMIDKSIGRKTQLTDIYIEVSTKGTGLSTKYFLEPLFEDDLEELDLKPLTDKQREAFELYDEELYPIPSYKELDKVADEIA